MAGEIRGDVEMAGFAIATALALLGIAGMFCHVELEEHWVFFVLGVLMVYGGGIIFGRTTTHGCVKEESES